jgi:citrate synthase
MSMGTGLKGVVLDDTRIAFIDGDDGKLVYRGYNIHDLAQNATFEEVSYLLLYGALPTRDELAAFDREPMDILRTAVSAAVALDESSPDATVDVALPVGKRLISQVATIVATMHRLRNGLDPVAPRDDLSHAANFLYMMFGQEPDPAEAGIIDLDLVLHAEHSSNASTFAARVAAGTAADIGSAIVAAIATLKGPLHGGAAEAVQKTVDEIGDPERAIDYIKEKTEAGEKVMGFGHRVYKADDPRGAELRGVARELGIAKGSDRWFQILVPREGHLSERGLLRRRGLLAARHPGGAVHPDVRRRAHAGLGRARAGAVRRQRADPAAAGVHGAAASAVRADRSERATDGVARSETVSLFVRDGPEGSSLRCFRRFVPGIWDPGAGGA